VPARQFASASRWLSNCYNEAQWAFMPQTGQTNQKTGYYKTVCCGKESVFLEGTAFPDCPNHRGITTIWEPIVNGNTVTSSTPRVPTPLRHASMLEIKSSLSELVLTNLVIGAWSELSKVLLITFIATGFGCPTESGLDVSDLNWNRFAKNPRLREPDYLTRSGDGLPYTS
jgi:hypothetical protein